MDNVVSVPGAIRIPEPPIQGHAVIGASSICAPANHERRSVLGLGWLKLSPAKI